MNNVYLDCSTNGSLYRIGDGLFAIVKAIDRLTEVLKPVEIHQQEIKINFDKDKSINE